MKDQLSTVPLDKTLPTRSGLTANNDQAPATQISSHRDNRLTPSRNTNISGEVWDHTHVDGDHIGADGASQNEDGDRSKLDYCANPFMYSQMNHGSPIGKEVVMNILECFNPCSETWIVLNANFLSLPKENSTKTLQNFVRDQRLVLPLILDGGHWTVTIITGSSNSISIFDPLHDKSTSGRVRAKLRMEVVPLLEATGYLRDNDVQWIYPSRSTLEQTHEADSGIFVLAYAICSMHGISLSHKLDLNPWRRLFAAAARELFKVDSTVNQLPERKKPVPTPTSTQNDTINVDVENLRACLRLLETSIDRHLGSAQSSSKAFESSARACRILSDLATQLMQAKEADFVQIRQQLLRHKVSLDLSTRKSPIVEALRAVAKHAEEDLEFYIQAEHEASEQAEGVASEVYQKMGYLRASLVADGTDS
jgi:hypothetical protein